MSERRHSLIAQLLAHPQPTHAGHHNVQDHKVHLRRKDLQRPGPVFRFQNAVALPCQQNAHAVPDVGVVLRDQYRLCRHSFLLLVMLLIRSQSKYTSISPGKREGNFLGNLRTGLRFEGRAKTFE